MRIVSGYRPGFCQAIRGATGRSPNRDLGYARCRAPGTRQRGKAGATGGACLFRRRFVLAAIYLGQVAADGVAPQSGEVGRMTTSAVADALSGQAQLAQALRDYTGRIAVVSSFGAESAVLLALVADLDRTLANIAALLGLERL